MHFRKNSTIVIELKHIKMHKYLCEKTLEIDAVKDDFIYNINENFFVYF